MELFSYHVYSNRDGGSWLADGEQSWTSAFDEAACFRSYRLAAEIAAREAYKGASGIVHSVFALVGGSP